MTARYIVGDSLTVTRTIPDHSVDFLMTSPPFLALRSYLPADHPDKQHEIGSESTPAAFIDVLLELSAEWRRVLAPHGSIVVELGDTYAGSGGAGGDYGEDGLRAGTPSFDGGGAWPRAKSLTLIPEAYRFALVYGRNPHTGQASPAGRWQARNVVRRCSPNPPVGALGKKWRPATSELVVACPDDDRRYWDDVATRVAFSENTVQSDRINTDGAQARAEQGGRPRIGAQVNTHAGAPLLDWWRIVPKGYEGAHYAVYPPELCSAPIDAMCPRRVCTTCGRASERVTERRLDPDQSRPQTRRAMELAEAGGLTEVHLLAARAVGISDVGKAIVTNNGAGHNSNETKVLAAEAKRVLKGYFREFTMASSWPQTTTGWTTCGCPGTDGLRLDGFHDGPGWRPGIVCDPFAGTGTTLAVATGMGRDAIGIDLDPRNADLALDRVGPLLLTVEHFSEEIPA